MIRNNVSGHPVFSLKTSAVLSRLAAPGSVVWVEILSSGNQGTLVRIAGKIFLASALAGSVKGAVFNARIQFSGSTVFLHPVANDTPAVLPDVLERLGIPQSDISAFLVSFFQKINARLIPDQIKSLERLSLRFPGREKEAAEIAAVLSERGIEPSFELISRILDQGDSSGPDQGSGSDRDFIAFVNQKKGHDRHWVLVPFSRVIEGQLCNGIIRFLVDLRSQNLLETHIFFRESAHTWDFDLSKGQCSFTADPAFRPVFFEKFVVYLKEFLAPFQIPDIRWHLPGAKPATVTKPVDLEI
jgi:hypothetical protein